MKRNNKNIREIKMPLKLMYITNDEKIAKIAENSGVDWIFIDLEIIGKDKRQGHLDTVISRHSIDDVSKIKSVLSKSKLIVRINPIYEKSEQEINRVINDGADIIMLPFFKTSYEVESFIKFVNGRVETCMLVETPEAVNNLDKILKLKGIDYIHIGLNDLHLGYKMKFMFEPLANGMVENIINQIKSYDIPYGFGGIARLGEGTLRADNIIAEHYRLKSSMVILSRSFCDASKEKDLNYIENNFKIGISAIREYEKSLLNKKSYFFINNQSIVTKKVNEIVNNI
ncbi:MAG: aldolase/citrate lyase family protein [Pleomorphochaeta sp.]